MDNSALKRIITLIDMDCFYCQVESRLNPTLVGKPVAVVQYNQWKQGGIIAVNYEAREKGVTRFMRGEEAMKKCPELCLASVPCVRGKADLTRYRDAGAEVADVFSSFSDCVLRASIDEAFIDLTSVVDQRIRQGNIDFLPEKFPSTFVIGYSDLKTNNMEDRLKGTTQWLTNLRRNALPESPEFRLAVGAMIVEEIRSEVFKRTGFHCSAGIGHNKILAKLVAGIHKPKRQTVIPHENVPELYDTMPLRKIRNLGGKFGRMVEQTLSISHMSELYNFSKEELIEKFNAKNGAWLYDIARGIDHDPVTSRLIPESIGCSKNFRGPTAINSKETLLHWLKEMAAEVVERLEKDQLENTRRAKHLVVSFKQGGAFSSRSCALPGYNADSIALEAFDVLAKFNQAPSTSTSWDPPIENLGLSASKFISEKSTIATFLKEVKPEQKNTQKSKCKSTEKIENSNKIVELGTMKIPKGKTPIETEIIREHSSVDMKSFKEEKNGLPKGATKIITNESTAEAPESFFNEALVLSFTTSRNKSETESCEENVKTKEEPVMPANSFFAKMLAQRLHKADDWIIKAATPSTSYQDSSPSTSEQIATNTDEFIETCPECNTSIHLSAYLEHLDYHAAMKLDREINRLQVKTAIIKSPTKKKGSPLRKKRKVGKPIDQLQITSFFGNVPK